MLEQYDEGLLETVFINGVLTRYTTLEQIRKRIGEQIDRLLEI